uniref:rRNA methyltransferase 2, mitochondrial n=1 Tax=Tetraselmis sp. GSL018 TaxID=582737 RepID=A0A061SP03_9CHLO|mmetsp:Transcript_13313/g.31518  ORF Transcript_13313/g.31518 Transcript_13313/m.31518 type:complete len:217 (+) Transcript_13313:150-800(+)
MGQQRVLHDFYSQEAKRLGYAARSAFKLLEIQKRYRVIPKGGRVLDLGCFPGAWLQVACANIGNKAAGGQVLGVDLQATPIPRDMCDSRVTTWQGDARHLSPVDLLSFQPRGFHAVLSDMCPPTSGSSLLDAAKSLELQRSALALALGFDDDGRDGGGGVLLPGGSIVVKLLEGSGTRELGQDLRGTFEKVAWLRPKATRPQSKELFLIGKGRRQR